jgi:hypothetical protein
VEFFNALKVNDNKLEMFARTEVKVYVIDKLILGKKFKISTMGLKEEK